jgi:hypothetical protein
MGNTAAKEQRLSPPPTSRRSQQARGTPPRLPSPRFPSQGEGPSLYGPRQGRGGRPEFSQLLGLAPGQGGDASGLENRRETKAEREARRLERERANREKERERSMKEESVDGGYLVTQGVYTGIEDFNKAIVRQLMVRTLFFFFFYPPHVPFFGGNILLKSGQI